MNDALKVHLFPLSLSGSTFSWFSSLPYGSITSWEDLEDKFHKYFYSSLAKKNIGDLIEVRQGNNESGGITFRDSEKSEASAIL
jgi:hypothetical protein